MRGATQRNNHLQRKRGVSIHAPHAGRDNKRDTSRKVNVVSIHAPHAGRDTIA